MRQDHTFNDCLIWALQNTETVLGPRRIYTEGNSLIDERELLNRTPANAKLGLKESISSKWPTPEYIRTVVTVA